MMNKKGIYDILLPEVMKILIAVLCIILLIYLAVSLYGLFIKKAELDQAKDALKIISEKLQFLKDNSATQYMITAPRNWALVMFGYGDSKPTVCKDTACLCICKTDVNNAKNIEDIKDMFSYKASKIGLEKCNTQGTCVPFDNLLSIVNKYGDSTYDSQIWPWIDLIQIPKTVFLKKTCWPALYESQKELICEFTIDETSGTIEKYVAPVPEQFNLCINSEFKDKIFVIADDISKINQEECGSNVFIGNIRDKFNICASGEVETNDARYDLPPWDSKLTVIMPSENTRMRIYDPSSIIKPLQYSYGIIKIDRSSGRQTEYCIESEINLKIIGCLNNRNGDGTFDVYTRTEKPGNTWDPISYERKVTSLKAEEVGLRFGKTSVETTGAIIIARGVNHLCYLKDVAVGSEEKYYTEISSLGGILPGTTGSGKELEYRQYLSICVRNDFLNNYYLNVDPLKYEKKGPIMYLSKNCLQGEQGYDLGTEFSSNMISWSEIKK